MTAPHAVNSAAWHQFDGLARHICARICRLGGAPADAARLAGIALSPARDGDWEKTAHAIAVSFCRQGR